MKVSGLRLSFAASLSVAAVISGAIVSGLGSGAVESRSFMNELSAESNVGVEASRNSVAADGAVSLESTVSAPRISDLRRSSFASENTLQKGEVAPTPSFLPYVAIKLLEGTFQPLASEAQVNSTGAIFSSRSLSENDAATNVASSVGATVRHPIGSLVGWWLLECPSPTHATNAAASLLGSFSVDEAIVQVSRQKPSRTADTFFSAQWHLKNTGQGGRTVGVDLNVEPAWAAGYTGTGVRVAVVDDGVDFLNPDLVAAHFTTGSFDFEFANTNPSPKTSGDNHGTPVAGLVGARANNNQGVAAPAYGSFMSSLRLLAPNQSDATEASALTHMLPEFQVYVNSWGPSDNGNYEAAGTLALASLLDGIANGRNGRGAIYVWAGGNGGANDNANYDGFANLPETISVAAVTGNGVAPWFMEMGACHLVSGLSGVSDVVTTDRVGGAGLNSGQVGNLSNLDYTNNFSGSSAAAPMVAGVIAQMIQAKPTLSWRDIQHILVRSSRRIDLGHSSWVQNGAGFRLSPQYGAGLIDASAATSLAANWINVGPRMTVSSPVLAVGLQIPETPNPMTRAHVVSQSMFCEHVQVKVTLDHTYWGDIEVDLVSPSGTQSRLAAVHPGHKAPGYTSNEWTYMTVMNWGEQAAGAWSLKIRDGAEGDIGALVNWQLIIHGTAGQPGVNGGSGINYPEDVNRDGMVDVVDVQLTTNMILALSSPSFAGQGDVDGNSVVDVVDIQQIVNRILNP